MRAWRHRFRVWFEAEGYHDVMGQTPEGAGRTALAVRRMLGYKGAALRPTGRVEDCGHLGTDGHDCPRCRPALFKSVS